MATFYMLSLLLSCVHYHHLLPWFCISLKWVSSIFTIVWQPNFAALLTAMNVAVADKSKARTKRSDGYNDQSGVEYCLIEGSCRAESFIRLLIDQPKPLNNGNNFLFKKKEKIDAKGQPKGNTLALFSIFFSRRYSFAVLDTPTELLQKLWSPFTQNCNSNAIPIIQYIVG